MGVRTSVVVTSLQVAVVTGEHLTDEVVEAGVVGSQRRPGTHVVVDTVGRIPVVVHVKITLDTFSLTWANR